MKLFGSKPMAVVGHCALCIVNCAFPSFAFAAGHAATAGIETLTVPAINFVIYVALLYFIYRKYLKKSLAKSSQDVGEFIQRSREQLAEAERGFAVVDKRKSRLEDEKAGIILQHKKEGEIGRERILAKAYNKADNITDSVREHIESELNKSKKEIQRDIFGTVISLVEDKFEIISDANDKAMREKAVMAMPEEQIHNS